MSRSSQRVLLPGGAVHPIKRTEAGELPDDGAFEWAPIAPYWSVLWRSGVALAREVAEARLEGSRVVELGCGLGVPSLVAARARGEVLATDSCQEALDLLRRNARENRLSVATARVAWEDADELIARGPFDLVLAADVLYERGSVADLLSLLPRLGGEAWLADPGRPPAEAFLEQAEHRGWRVSATLRGGGGIHRPSAAA